MKYIVIFMLMPAFLWAQSWIQLPNFPGTERDDGSQFTIGNKVYCGLGKDIGFACKDDFYSFDLTTETWSVSAALPLANNRQYAIGFTINNKGYIFGGINCSNSYLNDLWEYDSALNTWTQKNSLPSSGRSGSATFTINNIVYIIGGKSATTNALPEIWAYNALNNTWQQKANLPVGGMWRGVAYQYNGLGFAGLGINNLDQYNTSFYQYTPTSDSWSVIPGVTHSGTTYSGYAQINQFGYLFGGKDTMGVISNSLEKIDLQNFTFTTLTSFPDSVRKGCMTFTGTNSYYITTGASNTKRFKSTWKVAQVLGIYETNDLSFLEIYPNPSNGQITIRCNPDNQIKEITISTVLGEVVFSEKPFKSETKILLHLIPGIYFLNVVFDKNSVKQRKIIIE